MKKTLVVLLGVNGALSSQLIDDIFLLGSADMIGFDVQLSTLFRLTDYHQCDLSSRESIAAAIEKIPFRDYQDLRLVICAARMNPPTFADGEIDVARIYERLQINLVGPCHFSAEFAYRAVQAGATARVVAVGSTAAYVGSSDLPYAAAKSGLDGMVRSLSKNLGPKGVVAFSIHTGIFQSEMSSEVSEERKAVTIASTHVKREGSVKEVSDYVRYYLLEAPAFATGQCIEINGGQHT